MEHSKAASLGAGFATADGRSEKALKIEAVLAKHLGVTSIEDRRILDYGCGSGHIAAHFASKNAVTAVDAVDQLDDSLRQRIQFSLIDSAEHRTLLKWSDASFDIAISNHVAAYVPSLDDHLQELFRVLRPGGVVYFATPNRYFPLEPHTQAPLIHWLPKPAYSSLLHRLTGKLDSVKIPGLLGILGSAKRAGFRLHDYTMDIVRNPREFHFSGPARPWVPRVASYISPTVVLIFVKASSSQR